MGGWVLLRGRDERMDGKKKQTGGQIYEKERKIKKYR